MTFLEVVRIYLSYVTRYRFLYAMLLLSVVVTGILGNLLPLTFKLFIDTLNSSTPNNIYIPFFFAIAILVAHNISFQGVYFCISRLFPRLSRDLTMDAVANLQDQDYAFHASKSSGKLVAIVSRGDKAVVGLVDDLNARAFNSFLDFTIPLIVIWLLSPIVTFWMALALILFIPAARWSLHINVKRRKEVNEPENQLTGIIVDNLANFETVKAFAKEESERERLRAQYGILTPLAIRYMDTFRIIDTLRLILAVAIISAGLLAGLHEYSEGRLPLSSLVAIIGYVFAYPSSINNLMYNLRDIAKNSTDFISFFELIKLNPAIKDPDYPLVVKNPKGRIVFENIQFAYGNKKTLSNISLDIKPGQNIALVGPSGAGKSTLVKLLLRYYEPSGGRILIDGTDISEITQKHLRELVGVVPQDPILFNASILFNVAYSLDIHDMDAVISACKQAHIHDFIMSLPDGYETIVGERGIKLSGGQRQRLAIARLLLKNPPILVFDEATSSLDSESEQVIQKAFREVSKKKTVIIIAHRLSTISYCDRIVVLKEGELEAMGSHGDLLKKDGTYKKLWQIQSGGFKK